MTSDEVEALRLKDCNCSPDGPAYCAVCTLIDEVRRLRDERDQARAALEPFAEAGPHLPPYGDDVRVCLTTDNAHVHGVVTFGHLRTAARVHAETGEKG